MQYPEDYLLCMMTLQTIEEMMRCAIGAQKVNFAQMLKSKCGTFYNPSTDYLKKRTFGQLAIEFGEYCNDQNLILRLKDMAKTRNDFAHSLLTKENWHQKSLMHKEAIMALQKDISVYIETYIFTKSN